MAFGTSDIEQVRASGFPGGAAGEGVWFLPGVVLLRWRSEACERLFQAYVDGRWAGVTSHPEQRELLVACEHEHPAAIEVVWVSPDCKYVDYSGHLSGWHEGDGAHAVIEVVRQGVLPADGTAVLYWDGGTGAVDYTSALAERSIWAGLSETWGWGLDGFGVGDFGYSGTGAPGWGRGVFGRGEFGFDADALEFVTEALSLGTYRFAVRIRDGVGNLDDGAAGELTVGIDPVPAGPRVSIDSYDEQSDRLVLQVVGD